MASALLAKFYSAAYPFRGSIPKGEDLVREDLDDASSDCPVHGTQSANRRGRPRDVLVEYRRGRKEPEHGESAHRRDEIRR